MEKEIWKDIIGYEGLYQISNLGRVKSLARVAVKEYNNNRIVHEKILIPARLRTGYLHVRLYNNGKHKDFKVHRLVANAFIVNDKNKMTVNHLNGKRDDNGARNLEWATERENGTHASINKIQSSKYRGVVYVKRCNLYSSRIYIDNKQISLGYFKNEIDAHQAYLNAQKINKIENKYTHS